MTTIIQGKAAAFTVQVLANGQPVPLAGGLSAMVLTSNGRGTLVEAFDLVPGDGLAQGLVDVQLTQEKVAEIPAGEAMLAIIGDFGVKRFKLVVEPLAAGTITSLFVRDIVVDEIRRDQLMAAAASVLQNVQVSDDYLWDKVRAAEADIAHTLRVPLVPTKFFPLAPSDADIAALDGMAWAIDPGYDYDPTLFERDKWGFLVTRNRPLIAVQSMRFAYPSQDRSYFEIPADWMRVDAKAGHIRLVPSSNATFYSLSAMGCGALVSGSVVPSMVQILYTAGLQDAARDYPELLDAIKKTAVLKIVGDAFLPQSGSISGDGLSQSLSVDTSKYSDAIDLIINGPKGSNGGLMTRLHGIRVAVA
jgi:hypothetical protein